MKVIRRLIIVAVAVLLVLTAVGYYVRQRTLEVPRWYRKLALDDETRQAAANSMDQKLIGTVSAARRAQAAEVRANYLNSPATTTAADSSEPITISLSEDEINAFFVTWDLQFHWQEKLSGFAQDPVILIENHELILAATVNVWNAVISLHLLPQLENGKLCIHLTEVTMGTLALPRSAFASHFAQLSGAAEKKLAESRQEAEISPHGLANGATVAAAMCELLLHTLHNEPAEPVLFVPEKIGHDSRSIPMQLTDISIADKTLTLTLQPMNAAQRQALLQHIRTGESTADAPGKLK